MLKKILRKILGIERRSKKKKLAKMAKVKKMARIEKNRQTAKIFHYENGGGIDGEF